MREGARDFIMLYTDLDRIPLDIFIDVFTGDKYKLVIEGKHSEGELSEQSERLITEYIEIIGGSSVITEISRKSNLVNLSIKIECMKAIGIMMKNNRWEDAAIMLSLFGFSYSPSDHDKIRKKVSSILSMSEYMIERINNREKPRDNSKLDKDYFVRERVAVMSHYGMQIRKNEISAKEYAFMVRRMCEEIKSMNKSLKRK